MKLVRSYLWLDSEQILSTEYIGIYPLDKVIHSFYNRALNNKKNELYIHCRLDCPKL